MIVSALTVGHSCATEADSHLAGTRARPAVTPRGPGARRLGQRVEVDRLAVGRAHRHHARPVGQLAVRPGRRPAPPSCRGDGELARPAQVAGSGAAQPHRVELDDLAPVGVREPGGVEHADRRHPLAPAASPSAKLASPMPMLDTAPSPVRTTLWPRPAASRRPAPSPRTSRRPGRRPGG